MWIRLSWRVCVDEICLGGWWLLGFYGNLSFGEGTVIILDPPRSGTFLMEQRRGASGSVETAVQCL